MSASETLIKTLTAFRDSFKRFKPTLPEGFKYYSLEDYVLNNAKFYRSQPLTSDELKIVFRAVGRRKFLPKQCFYNSMILSSRDLTYVEGYTFDVKIPLPILHAWVTVNNKVIDVTLRCYSKKGKLGYATLGEFDENERSYFGVAFTLSDVLKYTTETHQGGSLIDDWMRGYPLLRK